jgi:hypothetical protein
VRLKEIALARGAVELSPGTTTGMAVGTEVAQPESAAIATAPMGAEVHGGVHRAGASRARGHRLGWRRRRLAGLWGFSLTQGALRSLGQARKRFEFLGAFASGWLGKHDRLVRGSGIAGPQPAEHQEDTHQRHETELVEQEGGYHGNAPADDGGRGTL